MLHAAISVVGQSGDALAGPLAGPQPHVEGIEGQVGAQRRARGVWQSCIYEMPFVLVDLGP